MKKTALSAFIVLTFILYSLEQRSSIGASARSTTPNNPASGIENNSNAKSNSSYNVSSENPSPTANTTNTGSGQYKDGSYTGEAADAFYGNIQVKATIQNGKISDVQFLQYPNDRGRSIMINTYAMPYLKQEAIQAQSAQVDIVSGATDSSEAFMQSLSSALAKAQ